MTDQPKQLQWTAIKDGWEAASAVHDDGSPFYWRITQPAIMFGVWDSDNELICDISVTPIFGDPDNAKIWCQRREDALLASLQADASEQEECPAPKWKNNVPWCVDTCQRHHNLGGPCAILGGPGRVRVCLPTIRALRTTAADQKAELEQITATLKAVSESEADELERLRRASAIVDERDRQDAKWGKQEHALPTWLAILMEEVGELAAACLCHRFGNDAHPELDWKKEAIQVAAVALSMIEQDIEANVEAAASAAKEGS